MPSINIPQKRIKDLFNTLGNKQDKLPDGITGYFLQKASDGVTWVAAGGSSMGKSIGEVYYSQSSSAQDNSGGLPLFTGETIANANQLYPEFYAWVNSHTELQISAANYETALSTYGECPKYVIDTTNKTIRLPKLTNYVKMANTTDGIIQSGAGLPNITGYCSEGPNATVDGAFSRYGAEISNAGGGGTTHVEYQGDFNASRSSAIYGASDTVTPSHTTLYPWVCAYNAAIPASTAQAAQFQAALSNKADVDLSNCTKPYIIDTYHSGSSWYRVWSDGWCEQGGSVAEDAGNVTQTIAFLKTFSSTPNVQVTPIAITDITMNTESYGVTSLSTSNFTIRANSTYWSTLMWRAEGFVSQGA